MAQGQLYGRNNRKVDIHHIIQQYEIAAGATVNAGDFVEFVNGISGYQEYGTNGYTRLTRHDDYMDELTAIKLNDNTVFITYQTDHWVLYGQVLTISGNQIIEGSRSAFVVEDYYVGEVSVTKFNDHTVLVVYDYKYSSSSIVTAAELLTINGTSIISNGRLTLWSEGSSGTSVAMNGENQAVVIGGYDDGDYLYAITIQIYDNKIVKCGSILSMTSANTSNYYICPVEQNKMMAVYIKGRTPGTITSTMLTVDGMSLSMGTEKSIGQSTCSSFSATQLPNKDVFVIESESSGIHHWKLSPTSSSITAVEMTPNQSLSTGRWGISAIDNQRIIAMNGTEARVFTMDGAAMTIGTAYSWMDEGFELISYGSNQYVYPVVLNPYCVYVLYHANDLETSSSYYCILFNKLLSVNNNTISNTITNAVFKDQVQPATSTTFAGIATTSGVGGDINGAKDKVKIQTYTEPVHILESYKDVPTTDFYYNQKSNPATIFVTNNTLRKCIYTKTGKNILLWDIVDPNVYYINVAATEFTVDGFSTPMIKENITNGRQVQEIDMCVTKRDKICVIYKIDNITYLFSCTAAGETLANSVVLSNDDWVQIKIDTFSDEKLAVLYSDRKDIYLALYHTNGTLLEKQLVNTFSMDGLLDVTVSDKDYAYIAYSAIEATLPSIKTRLNEYMPKVQSYEEIKWSTDLSKTTFNLTVGDQTRPIIIEDGEGKFTSSDNVEKFFQDKVDAEFGQYEVKCNVTKSSTGYILEFERAEGIPNVEIMVSAPDSETDLYSKNAEVLETSDNLKLSTKDVVGSGTSSDPGSGYKNALPLLKMLDMTSSLLNLNMPIMQFVETNATTLTYSINNVSKTLSTATTIANFFSAINQNDDKFHIEYLLSEDIILLRGDSEIRISDNIGLFTKLGFTVKETAPASDYVHTSQSTYVATYDYMDTKTFNWKLIDSRSDSLEWICNNEDLILHTYPMQSHEVQLRFFDGDSPFQRKMMSYMPSQSKPIALGVVRSADDRLFIAMSDATSTVLYNEDWSVFCEIIDQPSKYVYPYLRTDKDIGIAFVDTNSITTMSNIILSGRYDYLVRQYTIDGIRNSKGAIIRVQNDSAVILEDIAKNAINKIFFDTIIQVGENYTLRHDGEKWVVLTY